MTDTLEIFGTEYTNVTGIKATDNNDQIKTYVRPQGTYSITSNGTGIDVASYASVDVNVSKKYTATITETGNSSYLFVRYPGQNGTKYYTSGDTFEIYPNDEIFIYAIGSRGGGYIYVNGELVKSNQSYGVNYTYTVPTTTNVEISLVYGVTGYAYLTEVRNELSITQNGEHDVIEYDYVDVNVSEEGFTINNIAMQTISGDISGNATYIGSYAFYYYSSLTTASFPSATTIRDYAFAYCTSLTTVSFPNATSIGNYAFKNCSSLTTISFPSATTIKNYAFADCTSLTTASFPNATTISDFAFGYCTSLTTASFPNATTISDYAFIYCIRLTTVSFPSVTTIGNYAFDSCPNLTTASFPNATSIGAYAFISCTSLTTVSFPNVTLISSSAFAYCTSLTTVSFPNATSIGNYAFRNCYSLLSLYLLGSSVCTNGGTSTFYNTPIGGYTTFTSGVYGSIFVPSSLYDSYISATNWVTYSSRFVSV